MGTYLDWFSIRSDAQLVALFSLRPDLANPSPANLPSLAARASNATSINRALATLNARTLQVLESAIVLSSLGFSLSDDAVTRAVTGLPAAPTLTTNDSQSQPFARLDLEAVDPASAVHRELALLTACALLWRDSDGSLYLAPGVEDIGERFPAGFGPLSANDVATVPVPDDVPPMTHKVISQLLWGPPVARVARNLLSINPSPTEPEANEALRWLLRNAYLELLDETHVYLPRQTGFALRGERTHTGISVPPLTGVPLSLSEQSVQAEGSRAATEIVRLVAELIALWEHEPAQSLRNGGLPVREAKRVSNVLDVSVELAVFVAELAFAARLIRNTDDAARDFAPTTAADAWLDLDVTHRWSHLVQGWLASSRQSWLIGQATEQGIVLGALHPDLHAPWVPRLRGNVLGVLKAHPLVPISAEIAIEQLGWFAPRASQQDAAVAGLLHEATVIGLVASGALLPGVADTGLADALAFALPQPVGEIFIQGDLTGMVPGRPTPALEALLEASAIVESRGGALTVRFTKESITRAFDSGLAAAQLIEDLEVFSVTPIPQPLTYLISDVARRHGQVRVGALASYIKLVDEATTAAVLSLPSAASVGLFAIAPLVVGASAPISAVLTVLREAGFAPAIESPDGQVVAIDRQSDRIRVQPRSVRNSFDTHGGVSAAFAGESAVRDVHLVLPSLVNVPESSSALSRLVTEIRATSALPVAPATRKETQGNISGNSPVEHTAPTPRSATKYARVPQPDGETGVLVVNLREAIASGSLVNVALAETSGKLTNRTLKPLTLDSGRLRALDPERESELTVAIHRIASVTLL